MLFAYLANCCKTCGENAKKCDLTLSSSTQSLSINITEQNASELLDFFSLFLFFIWTVAQDLICENEDQKLPTPTPDGCFPLTTSPLFPPGWWRALTVKLQVSASSSLLLPVFVLPGWKICTVSCFSGFSSVFFFFVEQHKITGDFYTLLFVCVNICGGLMRHIYIFE